MSSASPPFFFVIPLHGEAPYAHLAVESAISQVEPPVRVVLIRDDNYDDSDLLSKFPHGSIEYQKAHTWGIAANWNNALDYVTDGYCTILHQDDVLHPQYASVITTLFREHPDAAAFAGAWTINTSGRRIFSLADFVKTLLRPRGPIVRLRGETGLVSIVRGNWIFCPTVCYNLTKPFPWRFRAEYEMVLDLDMYLQILLHGGAIVGTHRPLYYYRRHSGSTTSQLTQSLGRFQEEVVYYQKMSRLLNEQGYGRAASVCRRRVILRLHIISVALTAIIAGDLRRFFNLFVLATT